MIKKKHGKAVIAGVLVLALVSGGVVFARNSISKKAVAVYPVSSAGFTTWEDSQNIEGQVTDSAKQEVKRSSGLIDSINVKVGSKVKKGDVLLKYNKESVKLAVEADEASIALIEARIESANAEISRLQSLHTSEEAPEPYEQVIHHKADPVNTVSTIDVGTAASAEGNVYYCTKDTVVTAAMLQNLDDTDQTAEFIIYDQNVQIGSWKVDGSTISSGSKIIYIIEEKEKEDPKEPDTPEGENPPESGEGNKPESESGEVPSESGTQSLENVASASEYTTVRETRREEMGPYEDWILGDGVTFAGDGTVSVDYSKKHYGTLTSLVPEEAEWDETIIIDPGVDYSGDNYSYTREELAQLIKDKQNECKENELSLKEAQLKLKEDKLVSADGKVLSGMDGVVTEVNNPDSVKTGETLITVKGEGGYTITAYVSEYMIRDIQQGDLLQVSTYESASMFTAEVSDISFEPAERHNGYGNSNMTYYPVIATAMDQDLELNRGEDCQIQRESTGDSSEAICLYQMFIRKDDQGSYCMIADENDRLKKVYVQTGGNFWGTIEVLNGITLEDRIAFPYGKNVQEGSPVEDKDSFY